METQHKRLRVCYFLTIYNEEAALPKLLEQLSKTPLPPEVSEYAIYAVDDASTDGTPRVLESLKAKYPLTVLRYNTNQGVPASFKAALTFFAETLSDEDVVILMEADGTSDATLAPQLVQKILDGNDLAIASREMKGGRYVRFPWYRVMGSKLINLFLRVMWQVKGATDYTIFYRAYRVGLLKRAFLHPTLRAKRSFAVNGEILLQLSRFEPSIAQVPLQYDYGLKKGPSRMKLVAALQEYMRLTIIYRFTIERVRSALLSPLGLVVLLALALRVWGIKYGLPDLLIPDEPALTRGALTMLKLHTFIPALHPAEFQAIYYPPLISYLFAIVLLPVVGVGYLFSHAPSLGAYADSIVLNPTLPWLTTRLVTVVVSTLSVVVMYRVTERIQKGAGFFAALFLATSYWHVLYSHTARHWAFSLLLITALVWTAFGIYSEGSRRWYVLSGIFAGLAFMAGVIGLLLLLVPIFAHLLPSEGFVKKFFGASVWLMGLIAAGFFGLVLLIDPHNVVPLFFGSTNSFHEKKTLMGALLTVVAFYKTLVLTDPLITVFGFVGLLAFLRQHRFGLALTGVLFLVPVVIYLGYGYMPHYVLLATPLLAVLAGVGMWWLFPRNAFGMLLVLCLFVLPLTVAIRVDVLLSRLDTRAQARVYVLEEVASTTRMVSFVPSMRLVTPTRESLNERLSYDPTSSRVTDTALLKLRSEAYPPAYSIFELGTVDPSKLQEVSPQWLVERHFELMIIDMFAKQENLLALGNGQRVASFPPVGGDSAEFYEGGVGHEYDGPFTRLFTIERMGPPMSVVELR